MPAAKIPDEAFIREYTEMRERGLSYRDIGRQMGLSKSAVIRRAQKKGLTDLNTPAPDEIDIVKLKEWKKEVFDAQHRAEEKNKLIDVKLNIGGPFGLLVFGDPHIDADGCDIEELYRHAKLTRDVDGLFGCTPGDMTNNWVNRLARLWEHESISSAQSRALGEDFVNSVDWLFIVAGNHDLWIADGALLESWIPDQVVNKPSEVRLRICPPRGEKFIINCRHDWAGTSQWNPAHGPMKAALMGPDDHVFLCGHKHVSAYSFIKKGSGRIAHAVKVATYKIYDRYARDHGFRDQNVAPGCVLVFQPEAERETQKVMFYVDVDEGVEALKRKRQQYRRSIS